MSTRAAPAPYVELHAHSAFSFADGASQPDELAAAAADHGYTHYALTDHDSLAGSLEFALAARAAGVVPITGAELTVVDELQRTSHVTVLVRTQEGYRNLCRLITRAYAPRGVLDMPEADPEQIVRAWGSVPPGRVPHQPTRVLGSAERPLPLVQLTDLHAYAAGLILLTGCARHGILLADIAAGRRSRAIELLTSLQASFGTAHVFVELQLAYQRGDAGRVRDLRALAEATEAPVVASGNIHAHNRARGRLHEALVAIRHRTTLEACEGERAGNLALVMRAPDEMARRFAAHPDAIHNTRRIAECIEFDLTRDLGYRYPVVTQEGLSATAYLGQICAAELEQRYRGRASHGEAADRLQRELAIIDQHQLSGFFLLHRDVLELAREAARDVRGTDSVRHVNPPGRGRGSSVESIVCYLTGLSHVDPIETGLRMGRFLNDEMPSAPDIDLDFPRDIRHEVLRRVVARYGSSRCAMVAAHATYRARGAIRDVGMALGLPAAELARIAARCDSGSARAVADIVDQTGPRWSAFKHLTREIAELPRQIGQHSGGVIIATDPLDAIVPIQPTAMPGRQICQWDKDSCGDAGFLKIDVLGLGMLSVVEECAETIVSSGLDAVDLSRIDYADPVIYDEIGRGDTIGTFQIESRAQIQSVKRVKPRNLHDLTIQVALIRPGPIIGNSVNEYVGFREALRVDSNIEPRYDHPLLEPVLHETHGAIIFQDQVIEVAMAIGGFSAGEADGLRRAMSRKRSAGSIEVWRPRFLEGAAGQGVPPEVAERIFNRLIGFSSYGFPRAHSVAFALLAYQSQWLRHYYPAHFMCALVNAQPMGFYTPDSLIRDAQRHGVEMLPICINRSDATCMVEPTADASHAVRIGLQFIKGVAWADARAIVDERLRGGEYSDIEDLARRAPVSMKALQQVVLSGATEQLPGSRRGQLWTLGLVARPRRGVRGVQDALDLAAPNAPDFQQLSLLEEVGADFATTGISLRAHPVELFRDLLPSNVVTIAELEHVAHGSVVEIAGAVTARQRPPTAKGIVFLLLEDESGSVNAVVKPRVYERQRLVIRGEALLRVRGHVERHGDVINLIAHEVATLPRRLARSVVRKPMGKFFH